MVAHFSKMKASSRGIAVFFFPGELGFRDFFSVICGGGGHIKSCLFLYPPKISRLQEYIERITPSWHICATEHEVRQQL